MGTIITQSSQEEAGLKQAQRHAQGLRLWVQGQGHEHGLLDPRVLAATCWAVLDTHPGFVPRQPVGNLAHVLELMHTAGAKSQPQGSSLCCTLPSKVPDS